MFDFEKLEVYKLASAQNNRTIKFLASSKTDLYLKEQWKRASLSMVLNLAKGIGRVTSADKKHFCTMLRGSVYECAALLNVVKELDLLNEEEYKQMYDNYEQISKMLLGLYRNCG